MVKAKRSAPRIELRPRLCHIGPAPNLATGLGVTLGGPRMLGRSTEKSGRGAAWIARLLGVQEVRSSNLLAPTFYNYCRNPAYLLHQATGQASPHRRPGFLSGNLRFPAKPRSAVRAGGAIVVVVGPIFSHSWLTIGAPARFSLMILPLP